MEPITTTMPSLSNTEELEKFVMSAITRSTTQAAAITNARRATFGGLTKSYADNEPDRNEKLDRNFTFLRAMLRKDSYTLNMMTKTFAEEYKSLLSPVEYKSLASNIEGTDSLGGYLVPPEFAADLAMLLGSYGYARRYGRNWGMSSNLLNISSLVNKVTVAWTAELNTIAGSKPTFDRTGIQAQKLAGLWAGSNEFLEDANIQVYNAIIEIFAEAIALAEDIAFFSDTDAPFNGLLHYSAANSGLATAVTVYQGGSSTSGKTKMPYIGMTFNPWDDWLLMLQSQNMAFLKGAKFYVDQSIWIAMLSYKDSQGRYIVDINNSGLAMSTGFEGQPKWYFHGYEVVVLPKDVMLTYTGSTTNADTPMTIFGNLQSAWATIGTRGGLNIALSDSGTSEGVNAFSNDFMLMRITERVAMKCVLPQYITILATAAS